MTRLDDFFAKPTDALHPRLRNWKERIGAGASVTLEVYRPESELGRADAEMNLHFIEGGRPTPLEVVPWDDELNAGLIRLGVRAIDTGNEAVRFALGLRAALRRTEREFGDGYFNAVFVELIKESDLDQHVEIADILKYVHANRPYQEGNGYNKYMQCSEWIGASISGRAHELTDPLKYESDNAKRILVSSLAQYLDERFSVSMRRRYGML